MKTYSVQIPVTGSIIVTVEAENAKAAEDAAWELADFQVVPERPDVCEAGEFETHRHVTRGNVCSAVCNDINVEEV